MYNFTFYFYSFNLFLLTTLKTKRHIQIFKRRKEINLFFFWFAPSQNKGLLYTYSGSHVTDPQESREAVSSFCRGGGVADETYIYVASEVVGTFT
jgi:hypothetical protein